MIKRIQLFVLVSIVVLLMSACGGTKYKPVAINEETDKCAICNMSIKDDPYATQIVTVDGQSLKFDDIGCMHEWEEKNGSDSIGAKFVRDQNTGDWLKYDKAYYAYDSTFKTPMAYGIIAFESKDKAENYISEQGKGKLMTASELATHTWEVNRDMMDMESMEMHNEEMHQTDENESMDMNGNKEGNHS
ncbi:nitrous oxide reductase accessory protein NosL [Paenibacillus sp. YAF4_2]|uniref:nitrous oxide reductase accessory protein NosL n=1 Tax=Paenibacillus sp. YAF4_2 TaxID=3233085 RepID=UPI003F9938A4